jgi:hypothetical protein
MRLGAVDTAVLLRPGARKARWVRLVAGSCWGRRPVELGGCG